MSRNAIIVLIYHRHKLSDLIHVKWKFTSNKDAAWIQLAQGSKQWRAFGSAIMNLRITWKAANFFTGRATRSFLRPLLDGVGFESCVGGFSRQRGGTLAFLCSCRVERSALPLHHGAEASMDATSLLVRRKNGDTKHSMQYKEKTGHNHYSCALSTRQDSSKLRNNATPLQ
jgi:hypothetical protein